MTAGDAGKYEYDRSTVIGAAAQYRHSAHFSPGQRRKTGQIRVGSQEPASHPLGGSRVDKVVGMIDRGALVEEFTCRDTCKPCDHGRGIDDQIVLFTVKRIGKSDH